jgi:hypothetical protein
MLIVGLCCESSVNTLCKWIGFVYVAAIGIRHARAPCWMEMPYGVKFAYFRPRMNNVGSTNFSNAWISWVFWAYTPSMGYALVMWTLFLVSLFGRRILGRLALIGTTRSGG